MFLFVHNFSKPLDSLSGNGDNIDVVQHFLRFIHDDIYQMIFPLVHVRSCSIVIDGINLYFTMNMLLSMYYRASVGKNV